MSTAFITGITGQDGYYLAKLLLGKGYKVHGAIRRSSTFNTSRIEELISEHSENGDLQLYYSDLLDSSSLNNLINKIKPDEVYNLAAQSHVAVSFQNPVFTSQTGTLGSISILEALRSVDYNIKYYQASSSEMYGGASKESLNEDSPFDPKSPYAASKVFAHNITKIYRESYDLFAVNGILFNHESPYRGETFVTRKITRAVGRIALNLQSKLTLGNLDASRDWGFAGDYVVAMHKMLQHDSPEDFVISTGVTVSVRDFVKKAFQCVDLEIEFSGDGVDEVGILKSSGKILVEVSKKFYRPAEVDLLVGNSQKAKQILDWEHTTKVDELVEKMVAHDLQLIGKIS